MIKTALQLEETGGPAFPITESTCAGEYSGLTKRDYFAAAALTGIIGNGGEWEPAMAADLAYQVADHMIRIRNELRRRNGIPVTERRSRP